MLGGAGLDPESVAEYLRLISSKAPGGAQHSTLGMQEAAAQARLLLQQQQRPHPQHHYQQAQHQQALQQQQQQQAAALLRANAARQGLSPAALAQLPGAGGLTPAQQQLMLQVRQLPLFVGAAVVLYVCKQLEAAGGRTGNGMTCILLQGACDAENLNVMGSVCCGRAL